MHSSKDLFQFQSELNARRIDMAVNEAFERSEKSIQILRNEFQEFKTEIRKEFQVIRIEMRAYFTELKNHIHSLDNRLVIVETKLGLVNASQREVRARFMDYSFKSAWVLLGAVASYVFMHFHFIA